MSGDSHVQFEAETYAHRVPEKFRDKLPQRIKLPNGGDGRRYPDGTTFVGSTGHYAGHSPETFDPRLVHFDEEVGHGGPEQRLREQDADGVDAEILYTIWGRRGFDTETTKAVVHAYNAYLAEEFCSYAPDRLLGIGLLPHSGLVDDDIAEMEHCKKLGLTGVVVYKWPNGQRYPTPEDDRFWAAALDLQMPISVHTAMNIRRAEYGEFSIKYPIEPDGWERPPICIVDRMSRYGTTHCGCLELTEMIMTGIFDRFPALHIYFAENQIGWIPIFKEQMDMIYEVNHVWAERALGLHRLRRKPSEYVEEHAYWGFFDDPIGVKLRHEVGIDRIIWGSDFPHEVTRWPESQKLLSQQLAEVPADERRKMLSQNLIDFFHLDR
ncbi:MAG TPA: amidohydrolase family protein [Chloroflexota bacterium]|nr:amidohydrolase family protein [Chloroflexota bacterium]